MQFPAAHDTFRLLPKVVDDFARLEPERVLAAIPLGLEVSDGFRDITAKTFAKAVDRLAWFLQKELGRGRREDVITYLGPSDIRYALVALAAAKADYRSFWTSPRNSFEAHKSLIAETKCRVFVSPFQIPPGIAPVIREMNLKHLHIPTVEDLLEENGQVEPFPFDRSYDEANSDCFTIVHTSGSTGISSREHTKPELTSW